MPARRAAPPRARPFPARVPPPRARPFPARVLSRVRRPLASRASRVPLSGAVARHEHARRSGFRQHPARPQGIRHRPQGKTSAMRSSLERLKLVAALSLLRDSSATLSRDSNARTQRRRPGPNLAREDVGDAPRRSLPGPGGEGAESFHHLHHPSRQARPRPVAARRPSERSPLAPRRVRLFRVRLGAAPTRMVRVGRRRGGKPCVQRTLLSRIRRPVFCQTASSRNLGSGRARPVRDPRDSPAPGPERRFLTEITAAPIQPDSDHNCP